MLALAALVTALTLTSCAQTGVSAADAYKIGCPAVDSALGGGTVVNKVSVAGLKALRDSNQLGPEAQTWLVAVIRRWSPPGLRTCRPTPRSSSSTGASRTATSSRTSELDIG